MRNKQSSIEWLQAIELERDLTLADWNKAKAMHKEESQKIFECGRNFQLTGEGTFEQVYNETYNQ